MNKLLCLVICLTAASFAFGQPYTIQQYLNIKSAGSPTFSPDAKADRLSDKRDRHAQVWMIDLPGGQPRQLTNYDDNISFVRWLAGRERIDLRQGTRRRREHAVFLDEARRHGCPRADK